MFPFWILLELRMMEVVSGDNWIYRACQKIIPLKNLANFSRTIERYDIKFYTLVTHSIIWKCRKFHYIIYRIDKITLLLVMAT